MRLIFLLFIALPAFAQQPGAADRLAQAYQDRILTESTSMLKTDEHISMYETLVKVQPEVLHYQNLLAGAYIQKVRESMDYSYLERASQIVNSVIGADVKNYEAARLRTEIALERHDFKTAADYSRKLIEWSANDSWNWGTLGDALTELGDYDNAADAYQKMVTLRPDLSSYNRAAYFRFLYGDVESAVKIMKMAISAGSPMAENTAWCEVELGKIYLKTGQVREAADAFQAALRRFPNYHPALAGVAHLGQALEDIVRVLQRGRHQLRRLVAGVAEHDPLIARALVLLVGGVDALGDVGRLGVQMAGVLGLVPVEALLLVADVLDRLADLGLEAPDDLLGQGLAFGLGAARPARTDLAGQDDAIGGHQGLARDAGLRLDAEKGVHDGVGDAVGDLVRVALGHALGREDIAGTAQVRLRSELCGRKMARLTSAEIL